MIALEENQIATTSKSPTNPNDSTADEYTLIVKDSSRVEIEKVIKQAVPKGFAIEEHLHSNKKADRSLYINIPQKRKNGFIRNAVEGKHVQSGMMAPKKKNIVLNQTLLITRDAILGPNYCTLDLLR